MLSGKPVCGSRGLPRLIDVPKGIDAGGLYANFDIQDNGPSWTILLTDGVGTGNASTAIAQVGCWNQRKHSIGFLMVSFIATFILGSALSLNKGA